MPKKTISSQVNIPKEDKKTPKEGVNQTQYNWCRAGLYTNSDGNSVEEQWKSISEYEWRERKSQMKIGRQAVHTFSGIGSGSGIGYNNQQMQTGLVEGEADRTRDTSYTSISEYLGSWGWGFLSVSRCSESWHCLRFGGTWLTLIVFTSSFDRHPELEQTPQHPERIGGLAVPNGREENSEMGRGAAVIDWPICIRMYAPSMRMGSVALYEWGDKCALGDVAGGRGTYDWI
ncbi:hypothetical protein BDN70DRAFT_892238 [Pholiota conissans]|uniref:Uncharacterized protein n=1 Tax=Pholiota conissans TaxID=109636 RepID=A0A9P5Z8S4_9AGAR|nr:hypothetical protein BDN70DRAFT_892238 [Pholiota conissans]